MQVGDAGRDDDVELVEVGLIAGPGDDLAVGGEDDAGNLVDRAGGTVVAGDPLGGGEGGGAGLDGEIDLRVVKLARRLGQVGGDADGQRGRRPGIRLAGMRQRSGERESEDGDGCEMA